IGFYPTADIRTHCKYLDTDIGETSNVPVTDGEDLTINESFSFQINANSRKETDQLISAPALLTVSQQEGTCDQSLYEQLKKSEDLRTLGPVKSFDSIVSIYEAFTGDKVDREVSDTAVKKVNIKGKKGDKKKRDSKVKGKGSKGSKMSTKTSKSSSASKKQKKGDKASAVSIVKETGPMVYGMCAIDFLPLFYGKKSFTETLMINPIEKVCDERMPTYKNHPKIVVTVSIDQELNFRKPVIMNFTVESIYNLPTIMNSDMDYKICVMLPMEDSVRFD
ncbi:hypothetical protein NQ314_020412, partial [Rhamnusium bicolor]